MHTGDSHLEVALKNTEGLARVTVPEAPFQYTVSTVQKFGFNADIDTGTSEDVWAVGGLFVPPTTGRVHDLVSTETTDTSDGTGARTVTVSGLDADGLEQSETVTMNGTSAVATTGTYLMIHRMIVATAGSSGWNDGVITATAQTDSTVTASIVVGLGQTLQAIYQVPANKTAFLSNWYCSINRAKASGSADVRIVVRPSGGAWNTKHVLGLSAVGSSYLKHSFDAMPKFDGGTLIKVEVTEVSANNSDITAGFDLFMAENAS